MFTKLKNRTIKTVIIILSLIVADAKPDFNNQEAFASINNSEYTIIEKCLDCFYATLLNISKSTNTDDNSCEDEDTLEIDDHIVIAIKVTPPHHYDISHLTLLPWPNFKDIYIEVIPPPPLLCI